MRIRQITIQKLFGTFDHVIPLNMVDRITILHGLNGFGKTTILRMLDSLFNGNLSLLFEVPFEKLMLAFEDGRELEIVQIASQLSESSPRMPDLKLIMRSGLSARAQHKMLKWGDLTNFMQEYIERYSPHFRRISPDRWLDRRSGQIVSLPDLFILSEEQERVQTTLFTGLDMLLSRWMSELRRHVRVLVIETERLQGLQITGNSKERLTESPASVRTVTRYSAEIAAQIRQALAQYGEKSQSLDRTFPARFVAQNADATLPVEELQDKLRALEARRSSLVEIGLLEQEQEKGLLTSEQIDPSKHSVLTVYVNDMEAKFQVFDSLQSRLELFVKLLNERFRYKRVQIDRQEGFRFVSDNGKVLPPSALSSGEQHELVILYMLLFKVQPDTLILMDEPELSLHVGWQVQFIEDMKALIKLTGFDLLLATHSPQIINDRWDLTVELKGP